MKRGETMRSVHPYEPFVPQGAAKLIIGTIPPYRFCIEPQALRNGDVNFYYGSRDNAFWHLIEQATGEMFAFENTAKAVEQRKAFLEKRGIGITDVVQSCIHRDGKSDDISLQSIQPRPIGQLLLEHPSIRTLIYTGRSSQNNSVMWLMNHHIADKGYHRSVGSQLAEKRVVINGNAYDVILLYSPSPNALRGIDPETRFRQYKQVFAPNDLTAKPVNNG